jgi:hypothetical protein
MATGQRMADIYTQVLREILVQEGRSVCDDPKRARALLRDYLGKHPGRHDSPINVLVLALEHRAVKELLSGSGIPPEMLQARIAARLQSELGQTEAASRWAVTTWASALGLPAATVAPAAAAVKPAGGTAAPRPAPPQPAVSSAIELDPSWLVPVSGPPTTGVLQGVPVSSAAMPGAAAVGSATAQRVPQPVVPSATRTELMQPPFGQRAWSLARRKPILLASVAGVLLLGIGGVAAALIFSGSRPVPTSEAAPVKEPEKPKPTEPEVDKSWFVLFRSADPSIWNDDVNKGPDHFAKAIELAPDDTKYLKLTNTATKDFVIIPMTKARLTKMSDDGRYGWDGTNHFHYRVHHLGIFFRIWLNAADGDVMVTRNGLAARGWGFGDIWGHEGSQGYSWAGKPITRTVFEIAVKSKPLTDAESKKVLKAGNPRE